MGTIEPIRECECHRPEPDTTGHCWRCDGVVDMTKVTRDVAGIVRAPATPTKDPR